MQAGKLKAVVTNPEVLPSLSGLYYFEDFISEDEQQRLVQLIDSFPFCEVRFQLQKHHIWSLYFPRTFRSAPLLSCLH